MKYICLLILPLLLACHDIGLTDKQIDTAKYLDSINKVVTQSQEEYNALKEHHEWELKMTRLIVAAQTKPDYKEAYRIIDSTEDAIYAGNYSNWFIKHREHRPRRDSIARAEGLIK